MKQMSNGCQLLHISKISDERETKSTKRSMMVPKKSLKYQQSLMRGKLKEGRDDAGPQKSEEFLTIKFG